MRVTAAFGRVVALLVAGAMALALSFSLTAPASADGVGPVVSSLDSSTSVLRVGDPDGSGASALTPAGYSTYAFDVSEDGSTLLLEVASTGATGGSDDATYALVLVTRSVGGTTSRVLASHWDVNPVLSADGTQAWWMWDGAIWTYTAGVTSLVTDTLFAPMVSPPRALAVSPDGTHGAVNYGYGHSDGVVLAASFTEGKSAPYFGKSYGESATQPSWASLRWIDNTTLLFAEDDGTTVRNVTGTLAAGGSSTTTALPALNNLYSLRKLGTDWWMWRDTATTAAYGLTGDLAVAPASFTPRVVTGTAGTFVPSEVAPPAETVAVNRSASSPHLYLSAASVRYLQRVVYATWADYLTALPGETAREDSNAVMRGQLQYSVNGTTWATLRITTSDGYYEMPVYPSKGNGLSQRLTRNTWFKWVFPGDYLVAPSTSRTLLVTVVPTVTARVSRSGASRIVYGSATRVRGTAVPYRVVGRRLVKVVATTITAKGGYSFGKRALARGTYRVVVPADRYWAAGWTKVVV